MGEENAYDPAQYTWDAANAAGLTKLEEVMYSETGGQSGYDAAGRLGFYRFARYAPAWKPHAVLTAQDHETYTHSYTLTYLARDGYLEDLTSGTSSNSNYRTSTTDSLYDGAGRKISILDTTVIKGAPDLEARRSLVYNAEGQVLLNKLEYKSGSQWLQGQAEDDLVSGILQNKWTQFYNATQWTNLGEAGREALYDLTDNLRATYVNGQQIASHTEAGTGLNASANMTGFSNSTLGRGQTQVQQGDTLGSIAQRVYGTSTLWYVLADANGLEQNSSLAAGTILSTPEVKTSTNDSSTFRPYDPGEMTGPTSPTMAYMPPPDAGCGTVGMIIMVIIIIIVTIYTAGAASGAAAAGATSTGTTVAGATASTAAAASTATAGVSTMSAGMAALSGGGGIMSAGTAIAASAAGGFVGSVAGQAVGSAMGVASFSWRTALSAGAAAGITAGIGSTNLFSGLAGSSNFVKGAVSAVSNNLVSQAANRLHGVETSFSWKSLAASAVSGGIAAGIAPRISNAFGEAAATDFGQSAIDFATGMVGGVVSAHVRRGFGLDGKVGYGMIAADAFGSMIANRMVGRHHEAAEHVQRTNAERKAIAEQAVSAVRDYAAKRGVTLDSSNIDSQIDSYLDSFEPAIAGADAPSLSGGANEQGYFGVIDLLAEVGHPTVGEQWHFGLEMQLNPVAKAKMAYGMLAGVISAGVEDVEALYGAAVAFTQARDDVRTMAKYGFQRAIGLELTHREKFDFELAASRTMTRVETLMYVANNLGAIVEEAAGNAWSEFKDQWAAFNSSVRDRDYVDAGRTLGRLAYNVVPLALGVTSGARASLTLIGRGKKSLDDVLAQMEAATKAAVERRNRRIDLNADRDNVAVPAAPTESLPPVPGQSIPIDPVNADSVPVFRVQGGESPLVSGKRSRQRISIDENGNPRISGSRDLNVSIGDLDHARYFQSLRPGSEIVTFKIPRWMGEFIQSEEVPQFFYWSNPRNQGGLAPKLVDPTKPGRSYELPAIWARWLEEVAEPGSGRLIHPTEN